MRIKYDWDLQYLIPRYWDTRTPLYQGMPKFFLLYQDLNDKKIRVFINKLKGKILDAGCGSGRFVAYADVGVDFSKGMLKRAKSDNQGKSFVLASILHLPFRNRAFSTAFTVDVVLHIPPERRNDVLKELSRVSSNSYNFLAEHRTNIPFILQPLRTLFPKPFWLLIPYLTVFFAFPIDRVQKLRIDSASQILGKLAA